jgi:hypothetical protein
MGRDLPLLKPHPSGEGVTPSPHPTPLSALCLTTFDNVVTLLTAMVWRKLL